MKLIVLVEVETLATVLRFMKIITDRKHEKVCVFMHYKKGSITILWIEKVCFSSTLSIFEIDVPVRSRLNNFLYIINLNEFN